MAFLWQHNANRANRDILPSQGDVGDPIEPNTYLPPDATRVVRDETGHFVPSTSGQRALADRDAVRRMISGSHVNTQRVVVSQSNARNIDSFAAELLGKRKRR